MVLTTRAEEALRKIRILQKYDHPQTPLAITRVLKTLNTVDCTQVVLELETPTVVTSPTAGGAN